jgi:hypothetical protein
MKRVLSCLTLVTIMMVSQSTASDVKSRLKQLSMKSLDSPIVDFHSENAGPMKR